MFTLIAAVVAGAAGGAAWQYCSQKPGIKELLLRTKAKLHIFTDELRESISNAVITDAVMTYGDKDDERDQTVPVLRRARSGRAVY